METSTASEGRGSDVVAALQSGEMGSKQGGDCLPPSTSTTIVGEKTMTKEERMDVETDVEKEKVGKKGDEEEDEDIVYPKALPLTLISIALSLAIFLTALDNLIIATAIPFITTQFNSLDDVGWYGAAYLITTGSFQLIWGKFYILFPIKWVFLTSITIFEVGSLICGATPNSIGLILGRAIAGLGSAGLFSGAMVIVAYSVPLAKRPVYFGVIGGVYAIASVAGPLLGGVFTDKASWRWCFYINLPIGAITIAVIVFVLQHPKQKDMSALPWKSRLARLDIPGNALFTLMVITFILGIQWGGTRYPWSNPRIIVLLLIALLTLIAFTYLQSRLQERATVPPRIIRTRSIWVACVFAWCLAGSMFFAIYYLPIWFQAVQGVSAVQSGIRNLPLILSMTGGSIVSGVLVTMLGHYVPFMIAGSALVTVGMGLITTLRPDAGSGAWIGYQVLVGLGIGAAMQQGMIAVQTVLPLRDIPTGTALLIFAQTLGGAVGITIGQAIFSNRLLKNIVADAPGIDPLFVVGLGASHVQEGLPAQFVRGVVRAYSDAITTAFYVAVAFCVAGTVAACGMEWRSVKKPVSEEGVVKKKGDLESGGVSECGKEAGDVSQESGDVSSEKEADVVAVDEVKGEVGNELKDEKVGVQEEKSKVKEEKSK